MRLLRLLLLAGLLQAGTLTAQRDTSLTREFDGLSAKERNRIAQREQEEATQDKQYQALMVEGDEHFRAKRYEESLAIFSRARELRPYNVYPKVKIQDLQALIARRDAEQARQEAAAPPPVSSTVTMIVDEPPPASPPPAVATAPVTIAVPVPAPSAVRPAVRPAADVPKKPQPTPAVVGATPTKPVTRPVHPPPVQERKPEPERSAPDGDLDERVYKEGRSVVRERRLMEEGRPVVYRRVTHPWGATSFFRDGIAITERAWNETFRD